MNTHTQPPGAIPQAGYLREAQLVSKPGRPGHLPLSSATLWRGVKAGTFPRPVKLGARITAWKAEDVHAWLRARGA